MYYIVLISIVFLFNLTIYLLLKNKNKLWELFLYVVVLFIVIVFMERIYGYFYIEKMPNSYSFSVLLSFSWLISIMNLVKKYNNQRVDIYKQLNLEQYLGNITFLKFFTILMTVFQLYLIFSKTIFQIV